MEEKIVNIWLSVRPSKRHPILIYKLQSGQRITVTLPTLYNDNPEDVAVAQEIYDRKRRQIALGMLDDAAEIAGMRADLPLHEFERKFMAHRNQLAALGDISTLSVDEDRKAFRALKHTMGSHTPLANINPEYVKKFVSQLRTQTTYRKKPYSNQTINKFLRTLSAAFNYAVKQKYIANNHFADFGKLKVPNSKTNIRAMSVEEIEAFRQYFAALPVAAWQLPAFLFAINTLCRAGSVLHIKYSDIRKTRIDGDEVQLVTFTEKRNTVREVPLMPEAIRAIDMMRRLARQPDNLLRHLRKNKPVAEYRQRIESGYIFFPVTSLGTLSKMMNRASRELLKTGSIRQMYKFHNLRDSGGTYLLENGVRIEAVSHMLGHSSIKTTQQHYVELNATMVTRSIRHLSGVHPDTKESRA